MTKYEHTHLSGSSSDEAVIAVVDKLIEENWEVWDTGMAMERSVVVVTYFLRKEITGPITHQSVPVWLIQDLQETSDVIQHDEDGIGDGAGGDQEYLNSLVRFYVKTRAILGLK